MRDVSELLTAAARLPREPLDLDAVVARGAVLRRRRAAAHAGAAGVLAAAALFPVVGALNGPSSADELLPAPVGPAAVPSGAPEALPTDRPVASAAPAAVGPRLPLRPAAPGPAGPAPRAAAPPDVVARLSPFLVPPSPATGGSTDDDEFPRRKSCTLNDTTAAPGQTLSCRFTATEYGGYRAGRAAFASTGGVVNFDWEVIVDSDGDISVYEDAPPHHEDCAGGIIAPGDRVTIILRRTASPAQVAAGFRYSCSSNGSPQ